MDQERAGGNPGLRKFTDVAVWAQEDLRTKAASPLTQPITKGRGSEEAEAAHGGRGAPGLGCPTMTISMRFTTPEPSNRFNRSAITARDRWSSRAQCG